MEVHPGVFVSNVATDEWQFDPEVGGEMHVLVEGEGGYAGMSRFRTDFGDEPWTLPEREVLLVLEGAARIEIEDGPTLDLGRRHGVNPQGRRHAVAPNAALQGTL